MDKKIFKSDRHFTVFDFIISHGQLLLRSSKDDDHLKNVDIIFLVSNTFNCLRLYWVHL